MERDSTQGYVPIGICKGEISDLDDIPFAIRIVKCPGGVFDWH
jgi:hypothetical protein